MDGYDLILIGAGLFFIMAAMALIELHGSHKKNKELVRDNRRLIDMLCEQNSIIRNHKTEIAMIRKLEERRIERAKRRAGQAQRRNERGQFA